MESSPDASDEYEEYVLVDCGKPPEVRHIRWNKGEFKVLGLEEDDIVMSVDGEVFQGKWAPACVTDIFLEATTSSSPSSSYDKTTTVKVIGTSERRLKLDKVYPVLRNLQGMGDPEAAADIEKLVQDSGEDITRPKEYARFRKEATAAASSTSNPSEITTAAGAGTADSCAEVVYHTVDSKSRPIDNTDDRIEPSDQLLADEMKKAAKNSGSASDNPRSESEVLDSGEHGS